MKANFRKPLILKHSLLRKVTVSILFMSVLAIILYVLITSPA